MPSTVISDLPAFIHSMLTKTWWDMHCYSHLTKWISYPKSNNQHVAEAALNPSSLAPLCFLDRPAGAFWWLGKAQIHPHVSRVACILYIGPAQFAETYHGSTWTVWVSHQVTPVHISAHDHALLSPPAPLVDLTPTHSGSAMLMLLSVVFVGLAVFVIYKFKRYVSLHPCLLSLFLLHDRFRSMHRSDVRLPCIAVMVSVNVLGRSRGLMFMPRCRMRKNERWSVKSVTLKTGPISLRLN